MAQAIAFVQGVQVKGLSSVQHVREVASLSVRTVLVKAKRNVAIAQEMATLRSFVTPVKVVAQLSATVRTVMAQASTMVTAMFVRGPE
jgi:hypothetical protein